MTAHLTQWLLMMALAQAPQEANLLKSVPADVDIAIRTRGVDATSKNLVASVKAMNPDWGNMIEGVVAGPLAQIREHHGAHAVASPFVIFSRLGEEAGGPPSFAVVIPTKEYKQAIKELSGGKDVELKPQDGGYDAFDAPDGNGSWYAAKGEGVVAFGSSKGLIADVAKGGGKRLDSVLTGAAAKSFFDGDLGVYLNAASLSTRFADQIEQGRQVMMAAMEQQAGNTAGIQFAKEFYGGLFDSIKYADILTLNVDFAEKGFHLASFLKLKADSQLAKAIPTLAGEGADALGKLPGDESFYVYMNLDARTFDRLQGMAMKMFNSGKPSPEVEKATKALHALGRIESSGSTTVDNGLRSLNVIRVSDPAKYIEANIAVLRAMSEGDSKVYKSLKVETSAQTHAGITFTQVTVDIDTEKLVEISGNQPGQADAMKAMFSGGQMRYWYGIVGKDLLQIVAPKWEQATKLLDEYRKGGAGVGQTTGFKAVRSGMPKNASFLMLMSVQGLTRMYATMFSSMTKNPNLKAPEDMPKEPAYIGISLSPHRGEGYELHVVVPAEAGPVISRGLVPIFQGMAGAAANP
jgi:hypothetical protein